MRCSILGAIVCIRVLGFMVVAVLGAAGFVTVAVDRTVLVTATSMFQHAVFDLGSDKLPKEWCNRLRPNVVRVSNAAAICRLHGYDQRPVGAETPTGHSETCDALECRRIG